MQHYEIARPVEQFRRVFHARSGVCKRSGKAGLIEKQTARKQLFSVFITLLIRPLDSAQASPPLRDKACAMEGARCFYLKAGSIRPIQFSALFLQVQEVVFLEGRESEAFLGISGLFLSPAHPVALCHERI